jgi:hypothetical protein
VARCPYLGLEEHGTNPFPFPSPSHHCYLTMPGLPVGQREQQRYCLSKRFEDCPLFLSHHAQEQLGARLPETSGASVGSAPSVESPLGEPMDAIMGMAGDTGTPEDIGEESAAQEALEPHVKPPGGEAVKTAVTREMPIQQPPVAREGVVASDAAPWTETGARRIRSPVSRALLWTASGAALLVFVCVAGLVLVGAASLLLPIDTASLQAIPRAPSGLLAVSLASFGGAILLLGLLVWALRQGPK